jgi:hypothetical protein
MMMSLDNHAGRLTRFHPNTNCWRRCPKCQKKLRGQGEWDQHVEPCTGPKEEPSSTLYVRGGRSHGRCKAHPDRLVPPGVLRCFLCEQKSPVFRLLDELIRRRVNTPREKIDRSMLRYLEEQIGVDPIVD